MGFLCPGLPCGCHPRGRPFSGVFPVVVETPSELDDGQMDVEAPPPGSVHSLIRYLAVRARSVSDVRMNRRLS
jgi:hypothetical protein